MAGDDLQSRAADLVRKILTVGVGAAFLTEESLRTLISEFKLPKELIGGLLETAGKTKNEFLQKLSGDVIEKLGNSIDPKALLEEILAKHEIEFNVRVKFHPRSSKSDK